MIIKRKTQITLALLVSSVFLFQNCATIIRGTSQKIPVTSNPSGAKVTVDGKEMGYAPLILKLKKKKKSHVIRIEKQGYNPLEIRMARKPSLSAQALSILGNFFFGVGSASLVHYVVWQLKGKPDEEMILYPDIVLGFILGWIGAIWIDSTSGANSALSPKELNVTLKKQEGKPQPNLILLDAEQFRNIKWIRIKCADSDGEENFEKN